MCRQVNSWVRKNSSRSSIPSCSNSICRTRRCRLPGLSSRRACSMMLSVSTPVSCTEIDGLADWSPILISPTCSRPFAATPQNLAAFLARHRRLDRPVVQSCQPVGVQALERLDARAQCRQEQRLHQAVIGPERSPACVVVRQLARSLPCAWCASTPAAAAASGGRAAWRCRSGWPSPG